MTRRVRATSVTRRFLNRLERELHRVSTDDDFPPNPAWRSGFCEGIQFAQQVIRKEG